MALPPPAPRLASPSELHYSNPLPTGRPSPVCVSRSCCSPTAHHLHHNHHHFIPTTTATPRCLDILSPSSPFFVALCILRLDAALTTLRRPALHGLLPEKNLLPLHSPSAPLEHLFTTQIPNRHTPWTLFRYRQTTERTQSAAAAASTRDLAGAAPYWLRSASQVCCHPLTVYSTLHTPLK